MSQQPTSQHRIVLKKVSSGVETELTGVMVVGRASDSGLQLLEGSPSRRHAEISVVDGVAFVEDLGSTNGTFVNGRRISQKTRLSGGDRLRFDVEEFELQALSPPAPPLDRTVMREPPVREAVASSPAAAAKKMPGAWADPGAAGAGGNKTQYIDPDKMKEMLDGAVSPQGHAAPSVDAPCLVVSSGRIRGSQFSLRTDGSGKAEWTIGTDADREIVIDESGVSGRHAKIVNEGTRWRLVDQLSANGTFVNGKRINASFLSSGDRVRFGPVDCVFQLPSGPGMPATGAGTGSGRAGPSRTALLGAVAFVVTLIVVYVAWRALS